MSVVKYILAGLGVLVILVLGWGLIEPQLMDVEQEAVSLPDLPATWEGRRVAQISDFQVGIFLDNESTVRTIVQRIVEEDPALVLLTGDFVYHAGDDPQEEIRDVVDLVRPLKDAGIPALAVLGNHDYAMRTRDGTARPQLADKVREALEETGIEVLQNEAVTVAADSSEAGAADPLYVVGLGPSWPGIADPDRALVDVPAGAPRIVMMHNPNAFGALPPDTAPLAVAGHTHGGQVRLPLTPSWSWLTFVKGDSVHADGWIDAYGAAGNRLYVNRGIGMGALPIRINCRPELTMFTLHRRE